MEIFDLVKKALPSDVEPDELLQCGSPELWRNNPARALADALRSSPRLNWEAYLARNPEVKEAGLEPSQHFLCMGIYEGKKLISWHPLKQCEKEGIPLFSIIIANRNNEAHIGKCIQSSISQTLTDIEIIIVDDASTDASPDIIQYYARKDKRIKAILSTQNKGLFMTRKAGVLAASGRYITFLDGDDFLSAMACEKLYDAIRYGYDIVENCVTVVNAANADEKEVNWWKNYANNGTGEEYNYDEIVTNMFINRKLRWNIWGRAILREICVYAYDDLEEGMFIRTEDFYSMTAVTRISRSLYKIKDDLYFYRFGTGLSTLQDLRSIYKTWFNLGETNKAIKRYIERYGLEVGYEKIDYMNCFYSIRTWLQAVPENEALYYFSLVKEQYGLNTVIKVLIREYSDKIATIAEKFMFCADQQYNMPDAIKTIGIYYHRIARGGVQTVLWHMMRAFLNYGYNVVIFIEEHIPEDLALPEGVKAYTISDGYGGAENALSHTLEFAEAIMDAGIDLMFHAGAFAPYLLWDLILLHDRHIPVIISYHGSEYMQFIKIWDKYTPQDQVSVFKCAHAVTCLSETNELYWRLNGVNAIFIPNPINLPLAKLNTYYESQNIAVMGRFDDDLKQINQSLLVFKEVVKTRPWIKLYLIGDFKSDDHRRQLYDKLKTYGIENNTVFAGWTDNPQVFLKECAIFLSTSYIESFSLGIAEAESLGMPCVIYDIPIEMKKDNKSIIIVPQRDYIAAARAINSLLDDEERFCKLSDIAVQKAAEYSFDRFANAMMTLINNYHILAPFHQYSEEIYRDIVKYASYYAERPFPAKWN